MVRPGAPVGPHTPMTVPLRTGASGSGAGPRPGGTASDVAGSANDRPTRSRELVRVASSIAAPTTDAITDGSASSETRWSIPIARRRFSASASPRGVTPTGTTEAATRRSTASASSLRSAEDTSAARPSPAAEAASRSTMSTHRRAIVIDVVPLPTAASSGSSHVSPSAATRTGSFTTSRRLRRSPACRIVSAPFR